MSRSSKAQLNAKFTAEGVWPVLLGFFSDSPATEASVDKPKILFSADQLLQRNRLAWEDYTSTDATARVEIKDVSSFSDVEKEAVHARMNRFGFAIVKLDEQKYDEDSVIAISNALDLGETVIPSYYGNGPGQVKHKNGIIRVTDRNDGLGAHGSPIGLPQNFHVDGTTQPIGAISTSIVLAAQPAEEGGYTLLFNSAAAFIELARVDKEAAEALLADDALIRTRKDGIAEEHRGPAFFIDETGKIRSRFSLDASANWEASIKGNPALRRAYEFLLAETENPDSPFRLRLKLEKGEALVLANSAIAHGREEYRNSEDPDKARTVYRAMYRRDLVI